MFKHYFENIEGISVYPIFSLIVFVAFFVGLITLVVKMSKRHCDEMSSLPLHSSIENTAKNNHHE